MSATVEEYHPEVVKALRRVAEKLLSDDGADKFNLSLEYSMPEAIDYLTQFLISECATPLPKSEGVQ